ncbi:ABC transporter ATP-binding protein [Yeosuana marina]|uniref:ABC transporter ATP-binding protein n=1 Tax=Yeosuana marina TaxID=1565536 RepID=UPI0030EEA245|tara:strand:- start:774 stop:2057 length:1284 start_codon:yes stop_codon:yes gene_type:complete
MSDTILKVENISKQYRLGLVGTGTISHDLNRWWYRVRGKEDPYLKIGEANDRSTKGTSDYVWALRDINFEVQRGEVLGIIGKNGAGKSTLLKILSKVTSPTTGKIKTKGRIASLLEVGTGFHGEMTGRENIYLNGAILGMTKKEIRSKIDEIIEFSGCERYIDTPVKRYSSGMTVRLAFAVAAFLEPEILVIDEVLAVGDAEFQKKAIGKMQDISRGEGRTVLFVSHNMAAVQNLCTRAIVLEHGKVVFEGDSNNSINFYLKSNTWKGINKHCLKKGVKNIIVEDIILNSANNQSKVITGQALIIKFILKKQMNKRYKNIRIDFKIDDVYGNRVSWFSSAINSQLTFDDFDDLGEMSFNFKKLSLVYGEYILSYVLIADNIEQENAQEYLRFEIAPGAYYKSPIEITPNHTSVLLDYNIDTNFKGLN